jgi:YVTN family beta-propeller protein
MRSSSARRAAVVSVLSAAVLCAAGLVAPTGARATPIVGPAAGCSPADPRAFGYHANLGDDTVSVVDVANNAEVDTITGLDFPWDAQVTHDGSTLYVNEASPLDPSADDVAVVNLCTKQVVKRIPTLSMAFDLISPDGTRLYATNLTVGGVQVIDTATGTVIRSYATLPLTQEAVSADNQTMWLVALPNLVYSINLATGLPNGLPVHLAGINPAQFGISPDGRTLAVADLSSGDVAMVDTHTRAVSTVHLGLTTYPSFAGFSPDSRYAWIACYSGQVVVIDRTTNTVAQTIATDGWTTGVGFSQDGAKAFVTTTPPGSTIPPLSLAYLVPMLLSSWHPGGVLKVIDAHTYAPITTLPTGNIPLGMVVPLP